MDHAFGDLADMDVPIERGAPYGRRILYRDEKCEVLLMAWREGIACAPHDHAEAAGSIYFLRGRFSERAYTFRAGELACVDERFYVSPSRMDVGIHAIHDMRADDNGLSLHVYLPRITGMRVFDAARRETLVVSEDCGAWVPSDSTQILRRERWR